MRGPPGTPGLELPREDEQDGRTGKTTSRTARLGLLRKVDLRKDLASSCVPPSSWPNAFLMADTKSAHTSL